MLCWIAGRHGDAAETQSELGIGILLDRPPAAARQRRSGGVGDADLDRLHLARDVRREHGGADGAAHRGGGRLAAPPGPARPALAAAQVAGRIGACARSGGRLARIATAGGAGRRRAAVLDAAQARQDLLREGAGEQRRRAGREQQHAGKRRQGDRPLGFHGPHCSARTKTGPPDGAEWLTGLQRGRLMGSKQRAGMRPARCSC